MCGTTIPREISRLKAEFGRKGAHFLDIPVSGGPMGAKNGSLRMWCGGELEVFTRIVRVLEVLGNPDEILYCGTSGYGQYMKGVIQLLVGEARTCECNERPPCGVVIFLMSPRDQITKTFMTSSRQGN